MAASDSVAPSLYAEPQVRTGRSRMRLSRVRFESILAQVAIAADFLTTALAIAIVAPICMQLAPTRSAPVSPRALVACSLLAGLLAVLLLRGSGAYCIDPSRYRVRQTEKALRISVQLLLLFALIAWLLRFSVSLSAFILAGFLLFALLTLQKQALFSIGQWFRSRGTGTEHCVVIGADEQAARTAALLLEKQAQGLRPVALAAHHRMLTIARIKDAPLALQPMTAATVNATGANAVVLATDGLAAEDAAAAASVAQRMRIPLIFLAALPDPALQRAQAMQVGSSLLTSEADVPFLQLYLLAKRVFDIATASLLFVLLAPVFACIALLIRFDSPGPVLFVQVRMGHRRRPFRIFKFRTMHTDAPHYAISPASPRDRRITRIGRMLRRTSLDELPQLINVLKGEMALVGPRPEMPFIVDQYTATELHRLEVPPGITGLWQLSADRAVQIHENLHYDLDYIRNRSFLLDAAILIHTLFFAMRGV